MGTKNLDVREAAKNAGIPLWAIAKKFGCNDSTFSRKLRNEFAPEVKERIYSIIEELAAEKERVEC